MSENDPIFKNAVRFSHKMKYPVAQPIEHRAEQVRDIILESVMLGRLDKTDLLIIAARDCSPMPSIRQVAVSLGLHHETVRRKVCHIKSLVSLCLIDA